MCKIDGSWEPVVEHREFALWELDVLWELDEWDGVVQGRLKREGNIFMHRANSFHYTAEITQHYKETIP